MFIANKINLRIPGPTPIPPAVQAAMNKPMIGHRSGEASTLINEVSERLKPFFGTNEPPLLFTGSGTSVLEAAVINTVQPKEEAIVVVTGVFGDRFAKILTEYGVTVKRLDVEWGKTPEPEAVKNMLKQNPNAKAVFFTQCETSTGVLNPIDKLAPIVKEHSDALVIVDAVSSLGAVPFEMDQWGVDITVAGSQKALMIPAGLAFAAVSQKAWKVIEENKNPKFYLDFRRYRDNLIKGTTPFTPAVSLLFGLDASLELLEQEGLPKIFKRHEVMKEMTRSAIRALSLPLMTSDQDASPTVTSVYQADGWNSESLRSDLKNMGIVIAGGQQHLKGKIFRIGHMGYCDPLDVLPVLSAIEISLKKQNVALSFGTAIQAAEEVLSTYV
ncbi:alanine--glyoxylate aminotransferase family protein [Shimazuella sp. AN120528]|uniref:pyridoxal-phosphate-dependent aminotransferase family protein n=1 Tax=Shimazuella soli TaxID=1892854 RepID=UPI001F0FBA51|nr:alanine--glyoxylate aminotransferase family protein [Shimazuella soli]MCH5584296.1 alanine--glyoxylate aminotransferase family protein [Shimazuella soli]